MGWTDIEELARLESELFCDTAWSAATWWAELAERPRREYVVAADDGRLAGYAGIGHGGEVADLMTLAVAPAYRRRGVGAGLLDEVLQRAAEQGASSVLLEVRADNAEALRLYRRRGFEQVGVRRRYYQPSDTDAVVLRLRAP
ncbi:MAG: ribosomal protein S18-alanine N-acetyltransferase [Dermatophilaceae bacterium]